MKKTVLFQGDSITDCGRTSTGGAGFNDNGIGAGYPAMIRARVMCDHPETDWNFINRGISGNRIVDLYARWRVDCLNLRPDVLSILIGVNDTWHEENHNGVEVPRFARFYRELLMWTRETLPSIKLVVLEPFLCAHDPRIEGMGAEVAERGDVAKHLAEEFGATFIPLQSVFNTAFNRAPREYWSGDGMHPSPAGHQLIADAWLKYSKISGNG